MRIAFSIGGGNLGGSRLRKILLRHFRVPAGEIATAGRQFPIAAAQTLAGGHYGLDAGPLQHDEIDVGEPLPVRCLRNGLWLSRQKDLPFAIMMVPGGRFGLWSGVQVEIAVPAGERGAQGITGLDPAAWSNP